MFIKIVLTIRVGSLLIGICFPWAIVHGDDQTSATERQYSSEGLLLRETIRNDFNNDRLADSTLVRTFEYDSKGRLSCKREVWDERLSRNPFATTLFTYDEATDQLKTESVSTDENQDGKIERLEVTDFSYQGCQLCNKSVKKYAGDTQECVGTVKTSFAYNSQGKIETEVKVDQDPKGICDLAIEEKTFVYELGLLSSLIIQQMDVDSGHPLQREVANFVYDDSGLLVHEERVIDRNMDGTADERTRIVHSTAYKQNGYLPALCFLGFLTTSTYLTFLRFRRPA